MESEPSSAGIKLQSCCWWTVPSAAWPCHRCLPGCAIHCLIVPSLPARSIIAWLCHLLPRNAIVALQCHVLPGYAFCCLAVPSTAW